MEKKLEKKYIEKFKNHKPLYETLKKDGVSVYEAVKHCYIVEVETIGEKLIKELGIDEETAYEEVIIPFEESMLSLEELTNLNYLEVEKEMREEMEKIL